MAGTRITDLASADALTGVELVEVSQLSGSVTITAATISAAAADNSFNDSANGFVAAGFAEGDRVGVIGFTGDVANNLVVGVVTALTAGKMTIGGTDGDVIVDEAAGDSVTIAKWVSRRAVTADLGGGGAGGPSEVVTETTTDADLDPANAGKYQRWTNAGAKTLTIQPESTTAQPENGEWHVRNQGAADLTIAAGSGVVINAPNSGTLVVPIGGTVTIKRAAEDQFDLMGQTVAAP